MSIRDARVYTYERVLYMISYRVYVYKVTRYRIPNIGVGVRIGVGAVEFQLKRDNYLYKEIDTGTL